MNTEKFFFCTDSLFSLRFAFYFYLGATIGNWFDFVTIFYLGLLVSFIWPRLYEEKQKEIDQVFGIAKDQCNNYLQLALSKLPPAITAKFPQLKPKET